MFACILILYVLFSALDIVLTQLNKRRLGMAFDYLMCARGLGKDGFNNEPGPVRYIKVPRDKPVYNPSHVITSPSSWVKEVQGLADGDENPLSISPSGDVLIFVHGYNNTIEAVLSRMRRLRHNLRAEGWRGEIISFDWPSANQVLNYYEDRRDGASVASEVVSKGIKLLNRGQKGNGGQKEKCKTNVHVLAHSAGAYVVMEAFVQAEKNGILYRDDWRVGQVAFISGDVSSHSLSAASDWSNPMFRRIMRFTNYSTPYDAALAVSNAKRLGAAARAGRVGVPDDGQSKVVNVGCGDHFLTLKPPADGDGSYWTHSWYFDDRTFARDLALTLEGAIDRQAIPTRRLEHDKLFLQDKPRPLHQALWGIKKTAQFTEERLV
jgi:pimeloyl-ACP methyl ester carboxylesterase